MSWDNEEWGTPQEANGDYARVDQLAGHLLIIFPIGYIEHSPTRFSQPGKPSDVIVCDVIDLDGQTETGNVGKVYRAAWWRSSKLIVGLRPLLGKRTLGRITKGVANNGMNAPWIIKESLQEAGALDRARAWAQENPHFVVSTFTPPSESRAAAMSNYGPPPQQQYTPTPGAGYQGPARQQAEFPQQSYPQQYQQQPTQPQPQYSGYGPPPNQNYPQQPQPGYPQQAQQFEQQMPPQQQFQQPPQQQFQQPPQQQFQQPPAQSFQGQPVPAYPVQSNGPAPDPGMLEQMRAARERREQQNAAAWQEDNPPF